MFVVVFEIVMKRPNLFIVGAPKSGTTSIYNYLKNHPEVFMSPIKEPHFFAKDFIEDEFIESQRFRHKIDFKKYLNKKHLRENHIAFLSYLKDEDYIQLFRDSDNQKYIGEASTGYLFSKTAAKEIFNYNNDAKIIICIRNPVLRAFSQWKMDYRSKNGFSLNTKSFIKDLEEDFLINDKRWGGESQTFVELGLYYNQIKRFFKYFPRDNIKIFFFDDFIKNKINARKDLFKFLDISEAREIDFSKKHNESVEPRNYIFKIIYSFVRKQQVFKYKQFLGEKWINRIGSIIFRKSTLKIDNKEYNKALHFFIDDVKKLEKLLEVDLKTWREEI